MTKIIPKAESLQQVREFRSKIRSVKVQLIQFNVVTLNRLAENLVLRTIHERMRDFGYSEKIIQGTTVSGVDIISSRRFRIFFHSEYFADTGFDVALAREKTGTRSHFVEPVRTKALHWNGNKFSRGHLVTGITESHIIENTLDELAETFLDEHSMQKREWLEKNLGGVAQIAI